MTSEQKGVDVLAVMAAMEASTHVLFDGTEQGRVAGCAMKDAIVLVEAMAVSHEEDAYVIERMGRLLAEIALIVNGPHPNLGLWSYHDLPEKVRALRYPPAIARLVSAANRALPELASKTYSNGDDMGAHESLRSALAGLGAQP